MEHKTKRRAHRPFPFLLVAFCTSCAVVDQFSCVDPAKEDTPSMSYDPNELRLWVTVELSPVLLSTNMTTPTYTVEPPLPAGLELAPQTGTISGTPEAPSPETVYTVRAMIDTSQVGSCEITIAVFDAIAPGSLSYTPDSVSVPEGSALPTMLASYAGTAESFAIVPPLSFGLFIDPLDGRIFGTCHVPGLAQHTVTVTNPLGSAQADITIDVSATGAGSGIHGLVTVSAGDQGLDLFSRRPSGFVPIDAEHFDGQIPIDVAATSDGRFLYVVTVGGDLYGIERDPSTGFCSPPVVRAQAPFARKLTVTPGDAYLIVVMDGSVARHDIQPDGSLCCEAFTPGPFAASAILATTPQRLVVATSFPGEAWCFDIAPQLALRGPKAELGPNTTVTQLVNSAPGVRVIATSNVYDMGTSTLSGALRELSLSTDAEIAAGADAVVQTEILTYGQNLSDGFLVQSVPPKLLVTDRSTGLLHRFPMNTDGSLPLGTPETEDIGGNPARVIHMGFIVIDSSIFDGTLILDAARAEITVYKEIFSSTQEVASISRMRSGPVALLALEGPAPALRNDTAFVTSAADSTLLAVRTEDGFAAQLAASPQGPVATGANPRDVVASQAGRFVYTADRGSDTISAFLFDEATLQLSAIETEALAPKTFPRSLAITPGGSHLFALGESGEVVSMLVDPDDGALLWMGAHVLSDDVSGAYLRMDPLARFLFAVQPAEGRVTTLSIDLPTGALSATSTLDSLSDPVDLVPAADGRFASLLERGLARIVAYRIDLVSGDLVATGATLNTSATPLRLVLGEPVPWEPTTFGVAFPATGLERMAVLDSSEGLAHPLGRNRLTGALVAGTEAQIVLAPDTGAVIAIGFGQSTQGLLGTSDGSSPRISTYPFTGAEADSVPIGAGPHAIATMLRQDTTAP